MLLFVTHKALQSSKTGTGLSIHNPEVPSSNLGFATYSISGIQTKSTSFRSAFFDWCKHHSTLLPIKDRK